MEATDILLAKFRELPDQGKGSKSYFGGVEKMLQSGPGHGPGCVG